MFLVAPKQKQHLEKYQDTQWKAFEEFRKGSTTCGLSLQADYKEIKGKLQDASS